MSVWLKTWKTSIFKEKHAWIASSAVVIFFFSVNLSVVFKFGYREYDENGTYTDYCQSNSNPAINFIIAWNVVGTCLVAFFSLNQLLIALSIF